MNSVTCSRCGRSGHNRRNRECMRVNGNPGNERVNAARRPAELRPRNYVAPRRLPTAYQLEVFDEMNAFMIMSALRNLTMHTQQDTEVRISAEDARRSAEEARRSAEDAIRSAEEARRERITAFLEDFRIRRERIMGLNNVVKNVLVTLMDNCDTQAIECPLCYDNFDNVDGVCTNCDHGYCRPCFEKFVNSLNKTKKPTCPMCRTNIIEIKTGNSDTMNAILNLISQ